MGSPASILNALIAMVAIFFVFTFFDNTRRLGKIQEQLDSIQSQLDGLSDDSVDTDAE